MSAERCLKEKRFMFAIFRRMPEYDLSGLISIGDFRTTLGVPLLREDSPIGVLFLTRTRVDRFTQQQIDLVTTFADQAVIAIENVRLFEDVQTRTAELSEALAQQTATSDVLRVISSSPGDLEPVFEAMLSNATRIYKPISESYSVSKGMLSRPSLRAGNRRHLQSFGKADHNGRDREPRWLASLRRDRRFTSSMSRPSQLTLRANPCSWLPLVLDASEPSSLFRC